MVIGLDVGVCVDLDVDKEARGVDCLLVLGDGGDLRFYLINIPPTVIRG
jgi:hypothetical protein